MPNYIATYLVANREITWNTDGTQTLNQIASQRAYMKVGSSTGSTVTIIDLNQYITKQRNLVLTTTLATVAATLTDLQLAAYATTDIPNIDPLSDGIDNRINVYDALTEADICVSWTSIGNPSIRDDIYQRALMDDLVISSKTRDLTNSLVSVNGVFHKTYLFNGELYVKNGFSNIRNTRKMKIAIYDTATVGGHTVLPITRANIDPSNTSPSNGVKLTFPGIDLTGKTVLMVLGGYLHALDDTYRIVNTHRIIVDTCKIDLINGFLHNPNTVYSKTQLHDIIFEDRLKTHRDAPLTVRDKIMYYLWNNYPTAQEVTQKPGNFISFDPPFLPAPPVPVAEQIEYYFQNLYPGSASLAATTTEVINFKFHDREPRDQPPVTSQIYAMFDAYTNLTLPANTNVVLSDYEWSEKYEFLNNAIGTIPIEKFTNPKFIYDQLLSYHTFFIVVNNAMLYARKYNLVQTAPGQFVHFGEDTPRGTLLYNDQSAIPYVIYSNSRRDEHNYSLDFTHAYTDIYKTCLNPQAIPSPIYDVKVEKVSYNTHLLELYSNAS